MTIGRHSDGVYRSCSRCGKELTDAASREAGVGPICRNKNNEIFARHIPANLGKATIFMMELTPAHFHEEIAGGLEDIKTFYFNKMERLQRANNDLSRVMLDGADFRKIVDWFDVALSYPCRHATRLLVIDTVEALGYAALAGVLRGDVCMSPATLAINGNVITLACKSSKEGWRAMRRAFGMAVKTPRYRGDKTPYQIHVSNAEKFIEIALRYWPFIDPNIDVNQILEQAKNVATEASACNEPGNSSVAVPVGTDSRPLATIRLNANSQGWFSVNTPWHGTRQEMYTMLGAFKAIPRQERNYNPGTCEWMFAPRCFEAIKTVIVFRYSVHVIS